MHPTLYLSIATRDRRGKLIDHWHYPARSSLTAWVRLFQALYAAAGVNVKCIDGVTRSVFRQTGPNVCSWSAVTGQDGWGILVGSDATPAALADYKLGTKIAQGAGAGQLSHGATAVLTDYTSVALQFMRTWRTFTNNSPGPVTINEAAIYALTYDNVGVIQTVCPARDAYGVPTVVPILGSHTVTYEFQVAP